jgi:hypothetical protein
MFISKFNLPIFINQTYINIFDKKTKKNCKIENQLDLNFKNFKNYLNISLNYRFCNIIIESLYFYNKIYKFINFSYLNNAIFLKRILKNNQKNNFYFGKNNKKFYLNIGLYQRYLCFLKTFF